MKLSIITPCYNEETGIDNLKSKLLPVIQKLRKNYEIELIFVDDGSTDKTSQKLRSAFGSQKGFILLRHKKNRNLGAALRTGFGRAKGDIIACLDSDCTYDPAFLITLLKNLDDDVDIVIASPYHPNGKVENVPAYRVILSKGISTLYRLLTGSRIHTFTSMVRIYRKKVIKKVKVRSDGFLAIAELLIYSIKEGFIVREVPVILRRRRFGESKMKLATTIKSHTGLLGRLVVGR